METHLTLVELSIPGKYTRTLLEFNNQQRTLNLVVTINSQQETTVDHIYFLNTILMCLVLLYTIYQNT